MNSPIRDLIKSGIRGRIPSRRAIAAAVKLKGYRLERKLPFIRAAKFGNLNLTFEDILELQRCRSLRPTVVVIGAFDGTTNDPTAAFIAEHDCRAILVEPQTGPFQRLVERYGKLSRVTLVNAAIDQHSGTRPFYSVTNSDELPDWTEQLGSFDPAHIAKHDSLVPGLTKRVISYEVVTLSFRDLISQHQIDIVDILQIDAEGMDAALLNWFPFESIKPAILHYEITHMTTAELKNTRLRLASFGYCLADVNSLDDDVAVLVK